MCLSLASLVVEHATTEGSYPAAGRLHGLYYKHITIANDASSATSE
jgi:hypothetical protein